ncbi:MAG: NosD domain-containing protein [Candidatus Bathyarchaeia archaeon]
MDKIKLLLVIVLIALSCLTIFEEYQIVSLQAKYDELAAKYAILASKPVEATYIVFKENETVKAKNGLTSEIDFNGTDASTVIQSALDSLTPNRTWVEKVVVVGSFTLSSKIRISGYTFLDLSQANLTLADNVNDNMIEASGWYFTIAGGVLNGNGAHQTMGSAILVKGEAQRFFIGYGMRIFNAKDHGIHLEGEPDKHVGVGVLVDIIIENCGGNGILSAAWSADHIFSRINCGGNRGSGICLSSSDANLIVDSLFWNNFKGVDIYHSMKNIVTGNRIDFNNCGICIASGSSENLVIGNELHNNEEQIRIEPDAGNGNIIRQNRGYIAENGGIAIFSGDGETTSFIIPHGLSSTPRCWSIEAASADAMGNKYVTANATHLIVQFAAPPARGDANIILVWKAET